MFESDDWEFGDDFLNDIDNANTSFDEGDRTDLKKRKIDNSGSIFSSTLLASQNVNKPNTQLKTNFDNKAIKKNKVFELFKKPDDSSQKSSVPECANTKKDSGDSKISQPSQVLNKRQRVAELFKSGTSVEKTQKEIVEENAASSKEPSPRQESSQTVLTAKAGPSNRETNWLTQVKKDNPAKVLSTKPQNASKVDERRKNLLNCFKKSDTSVLPKRTLVRKFPGPAGLLPADSDDSPIPMEILDTDSVSEDSPGNFDSSAFCSQRTKNLFTEGAWQLMLADLPDNFLKGYDIASIKQKAKSKRFNQNKVPFMAGIVQSIDYTSNNPKIVLKDFSGEIECCLHCKIITKHPNVLDYGVVVLLRDVGIIASNMYLYAMVSLNSLVSVYTHKERVVSTPNLKMIQSGRSIDDNNEQFEFENFDEKFPSVRLEKKVEEQEKLDTLDKEGSFEFLDNFFEKESDSNKENTERSPNLHNSINFDTSFDMESPMPFTCSTQRESTDATQKKNEPTKAQSATTKSVEPVDSLFDMDEEAFFAVDEHISQVEQSFFSSTLNENKKIGLLKCKASNQKSDETSCKQSPVKNQSAGNQAGASLERFAFQKKVPSTLLNSTVKPSDVQKVEVEKIVKSKPNLDSLIKKQAEPSKASTNSFKSKLLQFEKQDDSPSEDVTPPPVQVSSQFSDREDLFSCDDDILMSQLELDSL